MKAGYFEKVMTQDKTEIDISNHCKCYIKDKFNHDIAYIVTVTPSTPANWSMS